MASSQRNVEHLTLQKCTRKLVAGISLSPVEFSQKLLELNLVASEQVRLTLLQSMVDYHKASKLVQHITDIIEQYPERFEDFLCALRAFNWLEDTLKSVLEEYEVNQTKCRETKVMQVNADVSSSVKPDEDLVGLKEQVSDLNEMNTLLRDEITLLKDTLAVRDKSNAKMLQIKENEISKKLGEKERKIDSLNNQVSKVSRELHQMSREQLEKEEEIKSLRNQLSIISGELCQEKKMIKKLHDQLSSTSRKPLDLRSRQFSRIQTHPADCLVREMVKVSRASEYDRSIQAAEERAREAETRRQEAEARRQEEQTRRQNAETREREEHSRRLKTETRLQVEQTRREEAERNSNENERRLAVSEERVRHEMRLETQWVVERREIQVTGPELGRGGWATVSVAIFRGIRVAAKVIHNQIVSRHNIQLFKREMNMASRIRHPNLLQFIGATLDGEMVILTELMPTSLRRELQRDSMAPRLVTSIGLDVVRALNYLHLMQLIHRDISSANVLLEPLPNNRWKAKVSDYGTVNLLQQLETVGPGNPTYAAPEVNDPTKQSPKMDIFSFGVLLVEMLTGELPLSDERGRLLCYIRNQPLLALIQKCLSENREDRPSASDIISELDP